PLMHRIAAQYHYAWRKYALPPFSITSTDDTYKINHVRQQAIFIRIQLINHLKMSIRIRRSTSLLKHLHVRFLAVPAASAVVAHSTTFNSVLNRSIRRSSASLNEFSYLRDFKQMLVIFINY